MLLNPSMYSIVMNETKKRLLGLFVRTKQQEIFAKSKTFHTRLLNIQIRFHTNTYFNYHFNVYLAPIFCTQSAYTRVFEYMYLYPSYCCRCLNDPQYSQYAFSCGTHKVKCLLLLLLLLLFFAYYIIFFVHVLKYIRCAVLRRSSLNCILQTEKWRPKCTGSHSLSLECESV